MAPWAGGLAVFLPQPNPKGKAYLGGEPGVLPKSSALRGAPGGAQWEPFISNQVDVLAMSANNPKGLG